MILNQSKMDTIKLKDFFNRDSMIGCLVIHHRIHTYVFVSELKENQGMSVTNGSEVYASQIVEKYNLDPDKCIFIEHYPADRLEDEHFDRQEYTWKGIRATKVGWKPLREPGQIEWIQLILNSHEKLEPGENRNEGKDKLIYVLYDALKGEEISSHTTMVEAIIAKHEFHMTSKPEEATAWKIKDEATGELRNLTMDEYKKILKIEYGE